MFWKSFNIVIILIQQMGQIDDPTFNVLLRFAHTSSLIAFNITILNSKVVKEFFLHDPPKNNIII